MNRDIYLLLAAQFVTAFADNAILFTAVAMVLHSAHLPGWYVPALQASFLVAFVALAAWVGPYADMRPKKQVLTSANFVKAAGAVLMLAGVEPLLSYGVVGIGAALYSPAKYGILPELVDERLLVKANGWVEGSTILAIISGSLVGALVADQSIAAALGLVVVLYLVSGATALLIARTAPRVSASRGMVRRFLQMAKGLFASGQGRFAILGASLFWASAAVLRVALVAWAPAVLLIDTTSQIAELTLYSAVGVAFGAVAAPKLIPLLQLRRARIAAYAMGVSVIVLGPVESTWLARAVLLAAGVAGGLFLVPLNAALQDIGHKSHGAGGAVGVQRFFENLAMLMATGVYAAAAALGADPVFAIVVLGVAVVGATAVLSLQLPADPGAVGE